MNDKMNDNINDALKWAAEYGYLDMVKFLVKKGADVEKAMANLEYKEAWFGLNVLKEAVKSRARKGKK